MIFLSKSVKMQFAMHEQVSLNKGHILQVSAILPPNLPLKKQHKCANHSNQNYTATNAVRIGRIARTIGRIQKHFTQSTFEQVASKILTLD